jgi:arsenite methyltransferase
MIDAAETKSCCAALYGSDFARLLLGDSFHPGGRELTIRLGRLMALQPGDHVLDAAVGGGDSAIVLVQEFGCTVVGVDLGADQVAQATAKAAEAGLSDRVRFERGDAERVRMDSGSFDAVICECAFCTFPEKSAAAAEFVRVLRRGGRIGLSDLTRSGPLPVELEGLLAWIACVGDARPLAEYTAYLEAAGCAIVTTENHDVALARMVQEIQSRLLAVELITGLEKMRPPGVDFHQAKSLARAAADAVRSGLLGYSLIVARKGPAV